MSINFNNLDRETVEGLNIVSEILEDMAKRGVNFTLNVTVKDLQNKPHSLSLINPNCSIHTLSHFAVSMNTELKNRRELDDIVSKHTIVICTDCSNKPEDFEGDWLVVGSLYEVEEIVIKDGETMYKLRNMRVELPYTAYDSKRFRIKTPELNLN